MSSIVNVDEQITELCGNIKREIAYWEHMREHGCQDPHWEDGANMYLTRNHIIAYKRDLEQMCAENNRPYPDEMYIPTPPEVDMNYMADRTSERCKKFQTSPLHSSRLTFTKPKYDNRQCVFDNGLNGGTDNA